MEGNSEGIQVEAALFNEALKQPEKKKNKGKRREFLQKKLGWDEEKKVEKRYQRRVVLCHMFTKEEIEKDVCLILDLKEDVRIECAKMGEVRQVTLYDVCVTIKF